jgi:hypothetical protein
MKYTCIISVIEKYVLLLKKKKFKYAFYACNMQNAHNLKCNSAVVIAVEFIIGAT